jgi:hypothetical protein
METMQRNATESARIDNHTKIPKKYREGYRTEKRALELVLWQRSYPRGRLAGYAQGVRR